MDKSYKVFVGGLPVRVDRDAIAEFFAAYGTVLNCKLKKNQQTGRSLGFAYLTVKEKATYERLLAEPVIFQGRVIDVKPMWKKKELGDKLEEEKKKKIFVSNLPQDLTNPELMAYFSRFGQVLNAFIIKDPDTEGYKDYGYVVFKDISSIDRLINQADKLVIRGSRLLVERCTNAAQIALSKQASSLRGSKQSSALPKDSTDPLCSPLLAKEASPIIEPAGSGISFFKSSKSTTTNSKSEKCSRFNLFGVSAQPKTEGAITKFSELPKTHNAIASSSEISSFIFGSETVGELKMVGVTKSSFIIKAPSPLKIAEYSDDLFPASCTKLLILEASSLLDECEENYTFNSKQSRRPRRAVNQW